MTTVWGAACCSVRSNSPWPVWTNTHTHIKPCSDKAVKSTRTSLSPGSEIHQQEDPNTHTPTWSGPWYRLRVTRQDLNHLLWPRGCKSVGLCAYICKQTCACVCVFLRGPGKPAPAIDTLRVSHTADWPATGKKEMRGFGVWHSCLRLKECMALCLCALCVPYFLVSLWGCMGQRLGLCKAWASTRAFTLVFFALLQVFMLGRGTSERWWLTLLGEINWEEKWGGWMKGKEERG